MSESCNAKNIEFLNSGAVRKVGYKSLRGFIRMIRSQNKHLKRLGARVQFTIVLPIKE